MDSSDLEGERNLRPKFFLRGYELSGEQFLFFLYAGGVEGWVENYFFLIHNFGDNSGNQATRNHQSQRPVLVTTWIRDQTEQTVSDQARAGMAPSALPDPMTLR